MRRAIVVLVATFAIGVPLLAVAEPASAIGFITGVRGSATFNGPDTYTHMHCWLDEGAPWTGEWTECTDWTDVTTVGNWRVTLNLSCFGICLGTLEVWGPRDSTSTPLRPQGFFIGSVSGSGDRVALQGAAIDLRHLEVTNPAIRLDYGTGQATVAWPLYEAACGPPGPVRLPSPPFANTCDRFRNPSMTGNLVSGAISVSGL